MVNLFVRKNVVQESNIKMLRMSGLQWNVRKENDFSNESTDLNDKQVVNASSYKCSCWILK